jgi:hypothetical protein
MTGFRLSIDHNIPNVAAAIAAAPAAILRATSQELRNASNRLATRMKRAAPKFRSELANSVLPVAIAPLEHHVRAAKHYATDVEEGTRGGGLVPISTLEQWIKAKRITPRRPGMTTLQLAHLIQQGITAHGTKAQPFARPSLEAEKPLIAARFRDRLVRVIEDLRA